MGRKPVQMMRRRILGMQPGKRRCGEPRMERICQRQKYQHWPREPPSAHVHNNWGWRRDEVSGDDYKSKG